MGSPITLWPVFADGEVSKTVKESAATIQSRVLDVLIERELNARESAVLALLAAVKSAEKGLEKLIREGNQSYSVDGTPVGARTYTKEQSEGVKKQQERIANISQALTKAFETGDFSKVLSLAEKECQAAKK